MNAWWQRLWPSCRRAGRQDEAIVRAYARSLWALAAGLKEGDPRIDALAGDIAAAAAALNDPDPAGRPDYSTFVALETRLYALMSEAQKERHYWKVRERFEAIATPQARSWHEAARPLMNTDGTPLTGLLRSESRDADAAALLHSIGRCHLLQWSREAYIDGVRVWIVRTVTAGVPLIVVVGAALYALLDWLFDPGYPASSVHVSKTFLIGLIAIVFMGFLGAAMSTIRRLQLAVAGEAAAGAAQFDAASLQYGKRTIRLGMVSGAVFSLLLYFVFASGAGALVGLNDGLFPEVTEAAPAQLAAARLGYDAHAPATLPPPAAKPTTARTAPAATPPRTGVAAAAPAAATPAPAAEGQPARASAGADGFRFVQRPAKPARKRLNTANPPACYPNAGPSCGWFALIATRLGFAGATDFLKMLIWAFIAGFAERLIPDAIDRVVSRRQAQGA